MLSSTDDDDGMVLGTGEKTLQVFQDFMEKKKAKLGLWRFYLNHAQEYNLKKNHILSHLWEGKSDNMFF